MLPVVNPNLAIVLKSGTIFLRVSNLNKLKNIDIMRNMTELQNMEVYVNIQQFENCVVDDILYPDYNEQEHYNAKYIIFLTYADEKREHKHFSNKMHKNATGDTYPKSITTLFMGYNDLINKFIYPDHITSICYSREFYGKCHDDTKLPMKLDTVFTDAYHNHILNYLPDDTLHLTINIWSRDIKKLPTGLNSIEIGSNFLDCNACQLLHQCTKLKTLKCGNGFSLSLDNLPLSIENIIFEKLNRTYTNLPLSLKKITICDCKKNANITNIPFGCVVERKYLK